MVSLWAGLPHYISYAPNSRGALALFRAVTDYLAINDEFQGSFGDVHNPRPLGYHFVQPDGGIGGETTPTLECPDRPSTKDLLPADLLIFQLDSLLAS